MSYYARRNRAIEYLILANALLFFLSFLLPEGIQMYLVLQPATLLYTPWTLVTSMFMHASLSHIVFNMIALFFFGTYLERITSESDFLKVYFTGGIFAGLFYAFLAIAFGIPDPRIAALGASGAISALLGALIVLRPNLTVYFNFFFPMPLWIYGIVFLIWSTSAGIAFTAHLGGLIAGLIFGYYFKRKMPYNPYASMYGSGYGY